MKTSDRFVQESWSIPTGNVYLSGDLKLPLGCRSLVVFVHGSGSSRFSPRNVFVSDLLNKKGIGTLLFDLLTEQEEEVDTVTRRLRFDIDMLSARVIETTSWLQDQPATSGLPIGYFGASTGAAAALIAAAQLPEVVKAVVSRGGRPDLAGDWLSQVQAPTLLIVGGRDAEVLQLNKEASMMLRCTRDIAVVPGASHLFEEGDTLEQAARLASDWFARYLKEERHV